MQSSNELRTSSVALGLGEAMYLAHNQCQHWYQDSYLEKHLSLPSVFVSASAAVWKKASLAEPEEDRGCLGKIKGRKPPFLFL